MLKFSVAKVLVLLVQTMLLTTALPAMPDPAAELADDGNGGALAPSAKDWPMFRCSANRTGVAGAHAFMMWGYYNWTYKTGGQVLSSPAVANICQNDTTPEVVVGSSDGRLYCLDGNTGRLKWRFQAGGPILSSPAVGDIDGDGSPEVVFGASDNRIYALRGSNGSLSWRYTTRAPIIASPALADLDGNGLPEAVVGGTDGILYAFRGNGSLLWRAYTRAAAYDPVVGMEASPAVGDIDGDGMPEVVVVSGDSYLYAFSGLNGSKLWDFQLTALPSARVFPTPVISDLDGNGRPEIVVLSPASGEVRVFIEGSPDSSSTLSYPALQGGLESSPAVADVNGDGHSEILFGTDSNTLECLSWVHDEDAEWRVLWSRQTAGAVRSSPALAETDGDGKLEVIVGCSDRLLRALNAEDGSLSWSLPAPAGIFSSVAVGDGDGTGSAELYFGCLDRRIYEVDYNLL